MKNKRIYELDPVAVIYQVGCSDRKKVIEFSTAEDAIQNLPHYTPLYAIPEGYALVPIQPTKEMIVSDGIDIGEYDFNFSRLTTPCEDENYSKFTLEVTNEEEYQRYQDDEKTCQEDIQTGLKLFSKHYQSLWW